MIGWALKGKMCNVNWKVLQNYHSCWKVSNVWIFYFLKNPSNFTSHNTTTRPFPSKPPEKNHQTRPNKYLWSRQHRKPAHSRAIISVRKDIYFMKILTHRNHFTFHVCMRVKNGFLLIETRILRRVFHFECSLQTQLQVAQPKLRQSIKKNSFDFSCSGMSWGCLRFQCSCQLIYFGKMFFQQEVKIPFRTFLPGHGIIKGKKGIVSWFLIAFIYCCLLVGVVKSIYTSRFAYVEFGARVNKIYCFCAWILIGRKENFRPQLPIIEG